MTSTKSIQTSVRNCKYVNTHADHGYSRQRSVAIPSVVRSTIGYHNNSLTSCKIYDSMT